MLQINLHFIKESNWRPNETQKWMVLEIVIVTKGNLKCGAITLRLELIDTIEGGIELHSEWLCECTNTEQH